MIRVETEGIVSLWEAIKYSYSKADEVDGVYQEVFFNNFLAELLEGSMHCFVRISNEDRLESLVTTKIKYDPNKNSKTLHVMSLYSWTQKTSEQWKEDFDTLIKFAKKENCDCIEAFSDNPKSIALMESLGMSKKYITMGFNL